MITLIHTRNLWVYRYEGIEPNTKENVRYAFGDSKPNYHPMPAIRECLWCKSKHVGHSHFISDDGLIIPN